MPAIRAVAIHIATRQQPILAALRRRRRLFPRRQRTIATATAEGIPSVRTPTAPSALVQATTTAVPRTPVARRAAAIPVVAVVGIAVPAAQAPAIRAAVLVAEATPAAEAVEAEVAE